VVGAPVVAREGIPVSDTEPNHLFVGLLLGLHSTAWAQLGKVMHPMTGKVERDLEGAKETIDLLGILEQKTRGNLAPEEEKLLARLLLELRLNYVDESKRAKTATGGSGTTAAAASDEPAEAGSQDAPGEPPRGGGETEPPHL